MIKILKNENEYSIEGSTNKLVTKMKVTQEESRDFAVENGSLTDIVDSAQLNPNTNDAVVLLEDDSRVEGAVQNEEHILFYSFNRSNTDMMDFLGIYSIEQNEFIDPNDCDEDELIAQQSLLDDVAGYVLNDKL